jgi:hypothetical protein
MRRVLVTDIPMCVCVDGYVDIPDDTPPDELDEEIRNALTAGAWEPKIKDPKDVVDSLDLDRLRVQHVRVRS